MTELLRFNWLEVDLARLCLAFESDFFVIAAGGCFEAERFGTSVFLLNTELLVSERVEYERLRRYL